MDENYIALVGEIKDFIRKQVIKSGLDPEKSFYGYKLCDLEERVEKIPCRDWFKIITEISNKKDFVEWYLKFQIRFNEKRMGRFERATNENSKTKDLLQF